MKKHPQNIQTLLAQNENLLNITDKSELLILLNTQVKKMLPQDHSTQINVANLRQTTLIIETSNAVWAARLNFQKKQLLDKLKNNLLPALKNIEVKINPNMAIRKTESQKHHRQISQHAAEHIQSLAENINGSLGEKLKRLAALANRKPKN